MQTSRLSAIDFAEHMRVLRGEVPQVRLVGQYRRVNQALALVEVRNWVHLLIPVHARTAYERLIREHAGERGLTLDNGYDGMYFPEQDSAIQIWESTEQFSIKRDEELIVDSRVRQGRYVFESPDDKRIARPTF